MALNISATATVSCGQTGHDGPENVRLVESIPVDQALQLVERLLAQVADYALGYGRVWLLRR